MCSASLHVVHCKNKDRSLQDLNKINFASNALIFGHDIKVKYNIKFFIAQVVCKGFYIFSISYLPTELKIALRIFWLQFWLSSIPEIWNMNEIAKSESILCNQNSNFEIQSRKQVPYLVFWMHKLCCCCTCAKNFSMRFDHFLTHLGKLTFIGLCAVLLRLFLKGHWIEHLC